MRINIISRSNGVGLDQDTNIVQYTLESAGHDVTTSHCRAIPWWHSLSPKNRDKYDINIFLERCFPRWFRSANTNLLIPNQERFPHRLIKHLKQIDTVLCKSRHAQVIFAELSKAEFIGFTSPDRNSKETAADYQSVLHLAGKSTLKGTEDILELWCKHPDWPTLTLIQHPSNAPSSVPKNVRLISDYISDEQLSSLMNSHGIHLCPSRSEGWGHYIVEAMSCSAVVVTTDAPPMNELISPAHGVLVPFKHDEARHLGTNYYVDSGKLENQLIQLFSMSADDKMVIGKRARDWYDANDLRFKNLLIETFSRQLSQ
ncbi:glycosyltransferase [Rubritalea marina]|uniref:glycosyltransferase n=1 Tax=Rubritalea marina TaxID=361055 RepID=UPI000380B374|nr:glycosyltransferase [Rubritalea marina]